MIVRCYGARDRGSNFYWFSVLRPLSNGLDGEYVYDDKEDMHNK